MGHWDQDRWCWDFVWRREWFEWERSSVDEFHKMVEDANLINQGDDCWLWVKDVFSVRSAYAALYNFETKMFSS